ncbi:MAG: hypothetical protein R2727_10990 [Bacteroidales bacterium]
MKRVIWVYILVGKVDSTMAAEIGAVYNIIEDGDRIIFSTGKRFFIYMINSNSIEVIDHSDKQSLVLLMERVGEKIFVGDNIEGLFEFRGDTLAQPPGVISSPTGLSCA